MLGIGWIQERKNIEGNEEEIMREFIEKADRIAENALIPGEYWKKVDLDTKDLAKKVVLLSEQMKIHPAIVAGRIRFEKNNYRILSQFVGRGKDKSMAREFIDKIRPVSIKNGVINV